MGIDKRIVALCIGISGFAASASADLIAEESFVYTAGATVNGQTGGTGWSGGWITGQPTAFTSTAAISGAPSIGQTGGALSVSASGRVFRVIDTSPGSPAALAGLVVSHSAMFFGTIDGIGAAGTTVWVGVLVSGGSGLSGDETQYHLYDGARTDATSLALGDSNKDGECVAMLRGGSVADWGFERTCNHSTCSTGSADGYFATSPAVAFGGTHWSVTRLVFGATTTAITMWRDPTPGSTPPDDTAALALTPYSGGSAVQTTIVPALYFDTIAPNASGSFGYVVDEIRIATTFADLSGGVVGMPDGGVPMIDAGATSSDAGSPIDAGIVVGLDAGPLDAGLAIDAGQLADSGTRSDAAARLDGGLLVTTPGGCGCTVPRGSPIAPPAMLVLLLGLALRRRRLKIEAARSRT